MKAKLLTGVVAVAGLMAIGSNANTAHAATLDDVRAAGELKCGINTGLPGFAFTDDKGNWTGFDVAYCRALAGAVLGDGDKVKFVNLTGKNRFPALTSAIGHCFAAAGAQNPDWDPELLRQPFDELNWQNPPAFNAWLDDVAFARENGYAVDAGQHIGGVTVAAAPVHEAVDVGMSGSTRAIAGVGLSEQLKGKALNALAQDLKSSAAALSELYSENLV